MHGQADDEYADGPTASKAAQSIDAAIADGKSGVEILALLADDGMRVYRAMGEDSLPEDEDAAPVEEAPLTEEEVEDPSMGADEPGLEGSSMPYEGDIEPTGSDDGGMRGIRMAAVKYALDKDKEKKENAVEA